MNGNKKKVVGFVLHTKSLSRLLVLSAAQYSQVILIFDKFISCYKTLSDHPRNNFIT